MLEKLKGIKERYEQLTALLSDPAVIGDQSRYRELSKEQAGLTDIVDAYDEYMAAEAEADERKSQVGSGDRSERIRTYNFPQSRVTDHRIGLTLYKLEAFLDGDMDEIIDALILAERTRHLSSAEE